MRVSFRFLLIGALATGAAQTSAQAGIESVPAFSREDLQARPTDNWITNGGNLIAGVSGGVMGMRCYLSACDAGTGEFGHDTWSADSASLVTGQTLDVLMATVATGRNAMPPFPSLTREELQDLATYIRQELAAR